MPLLPLSIVGRVGGAGGRDWFIPFSNPLALLLQCLILKLTWWPLPFWQGVSPDAVLELRRTKDLVLCATKQAAHAIVRSLAAIWRHLWLKLLRIKEREKFSSLKPLSYFSGLLLPPLRQWSRFLGGRTKAQMVAFEKYIHHSQGPSTSYSDPVAGDRSEG